MIGNTIFSSLSNKKFKIVEGICSLMEYIRSNLKKSIIGYWVAWYYKITYTNAHDVIPPVNYEG
jgi:hypothetical protein